MQKIGMKIAEIEVSYKTNIKTSERVKISGSNDAFNSFEIVWNNDLELKECVYVLFLNRANRVLGFNW